MTGNSRIPKAKIPPHPKILEFLNSRIPKIKFLGNSRIPKFRIPSKIIKKF